MILADGSIGSDYFHLVSWYTQEKSVLVPLMVPSVADSTEVTN